MIPLANQDKIIIVDFGSQVTKLIARRVRELGVYSEVLNLNQLNSLRNFNKIKGFILSGGPSTVTGKKYPNIPKYIFSKKIPILGICYGLQLLAKNFGGKVISSNKKREFGRAVLKKNKNSLLIKNFFRKSPTEVWMSHQDIVCKIPKGFKKIASTKDSPLTIIENTNHKLYGIQFHPEVTHTKNGNILLKNFVLNICKAKRNWKVNEQTKNIIKKIKNEVGNHNVICALSGGVDSSVVALLINKAIKKKLFCMMVDTGLMRKNEFKNTYYIFKNKYKLNVKRTKKSFRP